MSRKSRISVGGCVPRIDPDKMKATSTNTLVTIVGVGRAGLDGIWKTSKAQREEIEFYLDSIDAELERRRKIRI